MWGLIASIRLLHTVIMNFSTKITSLFSQGTCLRGVDWSGWKTVDGQVGRELCVLFYWGSAGWRWWGLRHGHHDEIQSELIMHQHQHKTRFPKEFLGIWREKLIGILDHRQSRLLRYAILTNPRGGTWNGSMGNEFRVFPLTLEFANIRFYIHYFWLIYETISGGESEQHHW